MNPAQEAFAKATLYTDEAAYILVHLPASAITAGAGVLAESGTPFSALLVDKDEVTLVLPAANWEFFSGRLRDYRVADTEFRLITFDLPLTLDLIGFMALVSDILAQAEISLLAFGAFERDHILIPIHQFSAAWAALQAAQQQLSGE